MSDQNENKPRRVEPDASKQPSAEGEKLVLNSPDEASTLKDYLLWAGVIVLVVLTVYSPAIRGKFIWDDDRHVERSAALRMGAEGLQRIWFAPVSVLIPQYYP